MLPWGEMLRAALVAGIPPAEFWSLSLREWRWLTAGDVPLRADLVRLMDLYPDTNEGRERL